MPVIYVDVLFLINFIIDGFLLICTAQMGGFAIKNLRIAAGALLGGIYSVLIFFPDLPDILLALSKMGAAAIMIVIAVKISTLRDFFRGLLCFYISGFLLGGVVTALMYTTSWGTRTQAVLSNGSLYFNIGFIRLVLTASVTAVVVGVVARGLKTRLLRQPNMCSVTIGFGGRKVSGVALIDSGNSLTAPGGISPVAVVEASVAAKLFDETVASMMKEGDICGLFESLPKNAKMTVITYNAVGTEKGIMPGFKPDFLTINGKNAGNPTVAICSGDMGRVKIILNPDLLG